MDKLDLTVPHLFWYHIHGRGPYGTLAILNPSGVIEFYSDVVNGWTESAWSYPYHVASAAQNLFRSKDDFEYIGPLGD